LTSFADFGPLMIATDVDDAAVGKLALWLPTYLGQVEVERGLTPGSLPRPVDSSYANTLSDDEFPDHMLPAVIVTTADTPTAPVVAADGSYEATWHMVVSCVIRGRTPPQTRANAALLEGCVRRALVQNGVFHRRDAKWKGSSVAPVFDRSKAGRYLAAGICQFDVFVDKVVQRDVGPVAPDAEPYLPLGTVDQVTVDVEGVPPSSTIGA
jgi:hypothetical protein